MSHGHRMAAPRDHAADICHSFQQAATTRVTPVTAASWHKDLHSAQAFTASFIPAVFLWCHRLKPSRPLCRIRPGYGGYGASYALWRALLLHKLQCSRSRGSRGDTCTDAYSHGNDTNAGLANPPTSPSWRAMGNHHRATPVVCQALNHHLMEA